jgi:hypothetical protein
VGVRLAAAGGESGQERKWRDLRGNGNGERGFARVWVWVGLGSAAYVCLASAWTVQMDDPPPRRPAISVGSRSFASNKLAGYGMEGLY